MKRIYRSRTDKVFSGVCGGIGKYFGIDPTIVRIIWAILIFAMGTGLFAYIIAMIIIPIEPADEEPNTVNADGRVDLYKPEQTPVNSKNAMLILGTVILGIGLLSLIGSFFGSMGWIFSVGAKIFWPLIIIGVGALLLFNYLKK